jgi:hypothetical protein
VLTDQSRPPDNSLIVEGSWPFRLSKIGSLEEDWQVVEDDLQRSGTEEKNVDEPEEENASAGLRLALNKERLRRGGEKRWDERTC